MFWQFAPHWIAMIILIAASAFFSCSEAALFYLSRRDRRAMATGGTAQKTAVELLAQPQRLLTAILFWNLVINVAYFAVASLISIQLEQQGHAAQATVVAALALLTIIFFSEMLPKNVAVLLTRPIATLISLPLSAAVRVVDPVLPALHAADAAARRLFFPKLQVESYLDLDDLHRAITLSSPDPEELAQEEATLRNIVSLSDLRVEELMRPRTQYLAFRPPVRLDDLHGRMTPSGYMIVTEPDSEEIAGAIPLRYLSDLPNEHLEHFAEPVIYLPWCATVATALQQMRRLDREVAAVINEFGETVGIVTFDDILETLFHEQASRSARMLAVSSITQVDETTWHVTGMTGLRRLARYFATTLPVTKSVTVGGLLQELLQRVPETGDQVDWADMHWHVLDASQRGPLTVRISLPATQEHDA